MRLTVSSTMAKSGGPYIGPRGGRWADPQHKIPWSGVTVETIHRKEEAKPKNEWEMTPDEYLELPEVKGNDNTVHINHWKWGIETREAIKRKDPVPARVLAAYKGGRDEGWSSASEIGKGLEALGTESAGVHYSQGGVVVFGDKRQDVVSAVERVIDRLAEKHPERITSWDRSGDKTIWPTYDSGGYRNGYKSQIKIALTPEEYFSKDHGFQGSGWLRRSGAFKPADPKPAETTPKPKLVIGGERKGPVVKEGRDQGDLFKAKRGNHMGVRLVIKPTRDPLLKAGPYIGPRGGKWADPQHKVAWKGADHPDRHVKVKLGASADGTGMAPNEEQHYLRLISSKGGYAANAGNKRSGVIRHLLAHGLIHEVGGKFVVKPSKKDELTKALFIGPRGGRWADAAHKIPFDADRHSAKVTIQRRASEQPAAPKKQLILIERRPAAAVTVDQKEERKIDQAVEAVREKPAPKPAKITVSQKAKSRKVLAEEQGEHVWGTRKDRWEIANVGDLDGMSADDQAKACTKSRLMPKLDADALLEQGKEPGCILLRHMIEKAVDTKAGNNIEARKLYVEGIDFMERSLDACQTTEDVFLFVEEWRHLSHGRIKGSVYTRDQIEQARDDGLASQGDPPRMGWKERKSREVELEAFARESTRAVMNARMAHQMTGRADPEMEKERVEAKDRELGMRQKFINDGGHDAKKWSIQKALTVLLGRSMGDVTYETSSDGSFRTYVQDLSLSVSSRNNQYNRMLFSLGKRMVKLIGYRGEKQGKPYNDAKQVLNHWKRDGVTEESQVSDLHKLLGAKKRGPLGERKPFRWERDVPGEIDRVGGIPVDVADPVQFAKDFGLSNVQFGGWVSEEDADTHLRGAHGALFDLADMLGATDPKIVSLNGRLSIGFGARGGGRARAHYEPSNKIINITKIAGGGSLSHEWAHAIDNIIAVAADPTSSKSDRHLTHGENSNVSPVVISAVSDVMDTIRYSDPERAKEIRQHEQMYRKINQEHRAPTPAEKDMMREHYKKGRAQESGYFSDATQFSPGADGYWTRPHEMFARAFESYIEDTLEEQGRKSSYLVSGTKKIYKTGKFKTEEDEKSENHAQPYPQGEERKRINAAMRRLVDVLGSEQTLKKSLDALDYSARLVLGRQRGQSKTVRLTVGG